MVLVTGATGFVGRTLLQMLLGQGRRVSCLIRPSGQAQSLPTGPVRFTTGTLQDPQALRAAMHGVETIIHLAGAHSQEGQYTAQWINHQGTTNLVEAARTADVKRLVYLSHIRADRNSAYSLLQSKGAAEEAIRSSGLTYTVLRSSLIFGPADHFTTVLAMLIKTIPVAFPVIGRGRTRFQPIHVEDVAACLTGCLDITDLQNVVLPIGGPQHLSYTEVLDAVMDALNVRRLRLHLRLATVRPLVALTEIMLPNSPVSGEQLDLFNIDNTTDLGNIPRNFGFEPRRFTSNLDYLRRKGWRRAFLRYAFGGD